MVNVTVNMTPEQFVVWAKISLTKNLRIFGHSLLALVYQNIIYALFIAPQTTSLDTLPLIIPMDPLR